MIFSYLIYDTHNLVYAIKSTRKQDLKLGNVYKSHDPLSFPALHHAPVSAEF